MMSSTVGYAEQVAQVLQAEPVPMDTELRTSLRALTHAVVNVLHTVAAASELAELLVAGDEPAKAATPLARVESECIRAAHLLREGCAFLTFDINPVRDVVDLPALLMQCADTFTCPVRISVDQPLPVVVGDPEALGRAFTEILANAFQFHARRVDVAVSRIASRRAVQIEFRDDGAGFDALPVRVFEPFFGTLQGEHCGLGLALVARVVKAHGGTLGAVATQPGALFWIELPVTETA